MKFFLPILCLEMFMFIPKVFAATSPGLGTATSFSILSSTYTNTAIGTVLGGDLGYVTGPAVTPTVNGTTHINDGTRTQAGTDQGTALSNLNSQPCTYTFGSATDLASNSDFPTNTYAPGVYCISGAADIGGGGTITLSGSGTYIFRMTGALNTSANSKVVLANGASDCDVWWTPGGATTLGADSTFIGTDIDDSGITIGNNVNWTGRALAFAGTVTTTSDTITTPTCTSPTPTSSPNSNSNQNSDQSSLPAGCVSSGVKANPRIIESTRISPTSIYLKWGPYEGMTNFIVEYGFENGQWLYNTKVNGFSTTINNLHTNLPIWARVAVTDNCATGIYSEAFFTGKPGMPHTGFGPVNINIFQSIFDSLRNFFLNPN